MRAKQINEEGIGDILQPKKLSNFAKIVFAAATDLNSIGMETGEIDSHSINLGFLSFDILNIRRNWRKRVLIRYFDKELWNKYTSIAKDGSEIGANAWVVVNYNNPEGQTNKRFNTWENAKIYLFKMLHPNIDDEIRTISKEKVAAENVLKDKTDYLIMLKNIKDTLQ